MPRLELKIEGRGNGIKTNLVNLIDVAKALRIKPECTLIYQQFLTNFKMFSNIWATNSDPKQYSNKIRQTQSPSLMEPLRRKICAQSLINSLKSTFCAKDVNTLK